MDSQDERRLMADCMLAGGELGQVLAGLDAGSRSLLLASIPFNLEEVHHAVRRLFEVWERYRSALDKAADAWGGESPQTRDLGPVLDEEATFTITPRGREVLASLKGGESVADVVSLMRGQPKEGPDDVTRTERHAHQLPTGGAATSVPAGQKCACGNMDGPGSHSLNTCRS